MNVKKQSNIQSFLLKHFPQSLQFQQANLKSYKQNTSFSSQSNSLRQIKVNADNNSKVIIEEGEREAQIQVNKAQIEPIDQIEHKHYKKQSNYLDYTNPICKKANRPVVKVSKGNISNSLSTSLNTSMLIPLAIQLKHNNNNKNSNNINNSHISKLSIPIGSIAVVAPIGITGRESNKKLIESSRISNSKSNWSLTKTNAKDKTKTTKTNAKTSSKTKSKEKLKSTAYDRTSYVKISKKKDYTQTNSKNTTRRSSMNRKNNSFNFNNDYNHQQPRVSIRKSNDCNEHNRVSTSLLKNNSIPLTNYTSMCSRANSSIRQNKENTNSFNTNNKNNNNVNVNTNTNTNKELKLNQKHNSSKSNVSNNNSLLIAKITKVNKSKSNWKDAHSLLNYSNANANPNINANDVNHHKSTNTSIQTNRLKKKQENNTTTSSPRHLIDQLFKNNGLSFRLSKFKSNNTSRIEDQVPINSKPKNTLIAKNVDTKIGRNIINDNKIDSTSLISTMKDFNYYQKESNSLSHYIKDYYKKNKEYPNTNLSFYKYGRIIGKGAFGKVNHGLNVLTGQLVAIKSFNKKTIPALPHSPSSPQSSSPFSTTSISKQKILYETNLMRTLKHPNITKILETFESDKYILIIMEYISGGNLHSFVKKRRKLNEQTAKILFKQIIQSIQYIHSKRIVHRDIKLENILIDIDNNVKLCDFGVGKLVEDKTMLYDQCGTPIYMAPEIMRNEGYEAFPVDIWSSGIALYLMLSGTIPFNKAELSDLQYTIINQQHKPIEDVSDEANDLLSGLLEKDPNKRLRPNEILRHAWLNEEGGSDLNGRIGIGMNRFNLFTKTEMIGLAKTNVDYRKGNLSELIESFTMRNLNTVDNEGQMNVNTKSNILAPYTSCIGYNDNEDEEGNGNGSIREDSMDMEIPFGNELIKYRGKAKELNMNYELNNNEEIDNGIIIDQQYQNHNQQGVNGILLKGNKDKEHLHLDKGHNNLHMPIPQSNSVIIIDSLIKQIEKFGYNKEYLINSLETNVLCAATAAYYLLLNYFHLHSTEDRV